MNTPYFINQQHPFKSTAVVLKPPVYLMLAGGSIQGKSPACCWEETSSALASGRGDFPKYVSEGGRGSKPPPALCNALIQTITYVSESHSWICVAFFSFFGAYTLLVVFWDDARSVGFLHQIYSRCFPAKKLSEARGESAAGAVVLIKSTKWSWCSWLAAGTFLDCLNLRCQIQQAGSCWIWSW